MKKTDIGLIVAVVIFAAAVLFINTQLLVKEGSGNVVEVRVDGVIYGTYPLYEDQRIHIDLTEGYNEVLIQDGQAVMIEADCNDLICLKTKAIDRPGQSIICLPHRVSVEILGSMQEESDIDEISQ